MSLLDQVKAPAADSQEIFYVFYSRVPNSTVYYPDGSAAVFTGGKYATNDEGKATFLLQEIKKGNMFIFVDEVDVDDFREKGRMAELKARIIAEYEAEKAAAANADVGTSEQGKLKTVTSATVGGAAVNSSSGTQGLTLALKPAAPAQE